MQKKIIALAVAGLVSGGAFAQSNVEVFGVLDVGVLQHSGTYNGTNGNAVAGGTNAAGATNTGSGTVMASGQNKSSRLGFRGTENLGNGNTAEFWIETNLSVTGGGVANGAGAQQPGSTGLDFAGGRQIFTGIKGSWGGLRFGRQYTPFFSTVAAVDPFGAVGPASSYVIHPLVNNTVRANNALTYTSPTIGGATFSIQQGFANDYSGVGTIQATVGGGAVTSWNLIYGNGPLVLGAAQLFARDVNVTSSGVAGGAGVAGVTLTSTAVGGMYNFSVVKLHLAYNQWKTAGCVNAGVCPAANGDLNHGDWHLGLSKNWGAHTVKFAYNRANDKATSNEDANHWGFGYQYALSKRTELWAVYAKVNNSNGANYTTNFSGTAGSIATHGAAGVLGAFGAGTGRTQSIGAGMTHSF